MRLNPSQHGNENRREKGGKFLESEEWWEGGNGLLSGLRAFFYFSRGEKPRRESSWMFLGRRAFERETVSIKSAIWIFSSPSTLITLGGKSNFRPPKNDLKMSYLHNCAFFFPCCEVWTDSDAHFHINKKRRNTPFSHTLSLTHMHTSTLCVVAPYATKKGTKKIW